MNSLTTYRPLKKVLLFIIVALGINTATSWVYMRKIAEKGLLHQTDIRYSQNVKNINVLFMGQSRVQNGIDDRLFNNSINYSSYGENNIYTYYKLKNILNRNDQRINTVIIPYGFSSFFSLKNPAIAEHNYWNKYIDYMELGEKHGKRDEYVALWLQSKCAPYSRFIRVAIDKKVTLFKRPKIKLKELESEEARYKYALNALEYSLHHRNYYDYISYEYLKKSLNLCQEKNIRVIGIKYPITSYYHRAYRELIDKYQWNDSIFHKLLVEYNVELVDFEKSYFGMDELFKDTHHLNEKGKSKFSTDVKQKFQELNISEL